MRRLATAESFPGGIRLRGSAVITVFVALSLVGCIFTTRGPESPDFRPYHRGLLDLAKGDFARADSAFRESAARCESGREGRRALLFLSFLALDPRNPEAHADSAAIMAARFLNLPNSMPEETLEAEALYVAALDRGADPDVWVDSAAPDLAVRFENCDEPLLPRSLRPLPVLGNPTSTLLGTLEAERDSLVSQNQALHLTIEELQAELERIRELIRVPDTGIVRRPHGS